MTIRNQLTFSLLSLLFIAGFLSCEKKADKAAGIYSNGVFITCEGTFSTSNASISFYSYGTDSVYNYIFKSANNRDLGDVAQSITVHEDKAYIVVNNSNKVEMVNVSDFSEIATLTDLNSPRYLVIHNNKAYISCWGDQVISVIDINTQALIKKIPAGIGPEKMIIHDNRLFVANTNAYDYTVNDSTLTVIDLETDALVTHLNMGAHNPVDLEIDKNGKIWVLCRGKINWDTFEQSPSYLVRIDPLTLDIEKSVELFVDAHPANLSVNTAGDRLYYGIFFMKSGIYSVPVDNLNQSELFLDIIPYGFEINRMNGEFFVTHAAADFISNGSLERYSSSGKLLGNYTTGINANGIALKSAD